MKKNLINRISRILAVTLLIYNLGIAFHYHHIDLCLDCEVQISSPSQSHHSGEISATDCPVILLSSSNPAVIILQGTDDAFIAVDYFRAIPEPTPFIKEFYLTNSLRAPPSLG